MQSGLIILQNLMQFTYIIIIVSLLIPLFKKVIHLLALNSINNDLKSKRETIVPRNLIFGTVIYKVGRRMLGNTFFSQFYCKLATVQFFFFFFW